MLPQGTGLRLNRLLLLNLCMQRIYDDIEETMIIISYITHPQAIVKTLSHFLKDIFVLLSIVAIPIEEL